MELITSDVLSELVMKISVLIVYLARSALTSLDCVIVIFMLLMGLTLSVRNVIELWKMMKFRLMASGIVLIKTINTISARIAPPLSSLTSDSFTSFFYSERTANNDY